MIGCILLGAAGLMAVTRMVHRHHHGWGGGCGGGGWRRHHFGGPWGGHGGPGGPWEQGGGWDDDFGPGRHAGHWGPRFFMRAISDRLGATPAQERVIHDAADELRTAASKLRGEARQTRADVAGAFRKSHFDAEVFGELYARHDSALEELRKAFVGAGARIHDALDEKQRARLADMIESGPGRWRSWRNDRAGW